MASEEESMKFMITGKIANELECPVCMIEKQLRIFPCAHRCCKDCIANLAGGNGQFSCPTCRAVTVVPEQGFPVCPLSEYLRDQLKIAPAKPVEASNVTIGTKCSCGKQVEAKCQACKRYICYRCAKKTVCNARDASEHSPEDLDDLKAKLEAQLAQWKLRTEKEIERLQNQIKAAERRVEEKRSLLETSQILECEPDDAEKISLMEQILTANGISVTDTVATAHEQPSLSDQLQQQAWVTEQNIFKRIVPEKGRDAVTVRMQKILGGLSTRKQVREDANMFDDIRFPDAMCEGNGVYALAPNSKEYMQVKQNHGSRSSFGFQRPRIKQHRESTAKKYGKGVDQVETVLWRAFDSVSVEKIKSDMADGTLLTRKDAGEYGVGAYFHKSQDDALKFATMPTFRGFAHPPHRHRFRPPHHGPPHHGPPHHGPPNHGPKWGPCGPQVLHRQPPPPPPYYYQNFQPGVEDNASIMLIQTRVVTGEWTQGDRGMLAAPYKNASQQYDSVVDNVDNPTLFVVFNDAAAYPQYIIEFQKHIAGAGEAY